MAMDSKTKTAIYISMNVGYLKPNFILLLFHGQSKTYHSDKGAQVAALAKHGVNFWYWFWYGF